MRIADISGRLWWLAGNALGIFIFLTVASRFWVEPDLADVPGANIGSAFGWIFFAAPIFGLFVLANLIWLVFSLWRGVRTAEWASLSIAMLMLATWCAAYRFDNAHHGM
jgi:hypothetical protein